LGGLAEGCSKWRLPQGRRSDNLSARSPLLASTIDVAAAGITAGMMEAPPEEVAMQRPDLRDERWAA